MTGAEGICIIVGDSEQLGWAKRLGWARLWAEVGRAPVAWNDLVLRFIYLVRVGFENLAGNILMVGEYHWQEVWHRRIFLRFLHRR